MHVYNGILISIVSILTSSCVHYEMNDHAEICKNKVIDFTSQKSISNDGETKFRLISSISNNGNPIDPLVFWVKITGYNQGRKKFLNANGTFPAKWLSGADGIPMIYSTQYAFVQKEDGTRILAEPTIHLSSLKDPEQPGMALQEKFADINSDRVQTSNKTNMTTYGNYGSVYIKFNIPPPSPTSEWQLHLGNIQLGDEIVEIPTQGFCFRKGYSFTKYGIGLLP